ncbi:tRNA1(Val) (adenine(37)-N6)-methyltransferase [Pedobacter sp. KLB.chiD]|uniref:tRNA1(Val) (adenine(37)-N6)-methyltransferase n=1 Tax=Pedobacter sp. KLB.chiD TaxID=3387402 RepID=UPI00399BA7A6
MSIFKFKQFKVDQDGCAMKINTDGVLIGATANHHNPKNILDIGAGTGVIALMLAQRFPDAKIHAVEIDEQAAKTAERNFQESPFNRRLNISNIAIEQYHSPERFDLIVSNPPFFVNDLKNEEIRKGIARHAKDGFFNLLVKKISELLTADGQAWLILPVKQADEVVVQAGYYGMELLEKIHVHSDRSKAAFRQMISLGKIKTAIQESDFYLYQDLKVHTAEYKILLKDFFLAY